MTEAQGLSNKKVLTKDFQAISQLLTEIVVLKGWSRHE